MPRGTGWAASKMGCWRSFAPIQMSSSVTLRVQYIKENLAFMQEYDRLLS